MRTSFLILFALFTISQSANAQEGNYNPYDAYVFASKLNIREEPTSSAKVITQLGIGVKVSVLFKKDKWVKVSVPKKKVIGWTLYNFLYYERPSLQKILFSYDTAPRTHLLTRKMWAERAMALDANDPKAQKNFKEITEEIKSLKTKIKPTKQENKFKEYQWVYSKSYESGMSYEKLVSSKVEISEDVMNPNGLGTVNAHISDTESFTNLVKYDFDKDGIDEVVIVGKYWNCTVTKDGCSSTPTQHYVVMVLKHTLHLTDMHRWNAWNVVDMRTNYMVRNAFVQKTEKGVRVIAAENSAQCDMDRLDDYVLVWDPVKKRVVADDLEKTTLFNLEPHGYCGE